MKLLKALVLTVTLSLPVMSFAAPKKMEARQAIQHLMSNIYGAVGESGDDNCVSEANFDAGAGELTISIKQGDNELALRLSTLSSETYTYIEKEKDGYGTMTYITPSKNEVTIFQAEDSYTGIIIKKFDKLGRAQELKCTIYF